MLNIRIYCISLISFSLNLNEDFIKMDLHFISPIYILTKLFLYRIHFIPNSMLLHFQNYIN